MAKQKYLVIKRWHGVKMGDTVEFDGEVPKALQANVRLASSGKDHSEDQQEAGKLELEAGKLELPPVVPAAKATGKSN